MFAGFTQRNNFGLGGGTVSPPSAFPTRPIGQLGNFNLFATNFLAVTGITNSNIQSAINQLCTDLVNTGLMDKMIAVYPFVGGSATTHKYNLKDPRDADTAFRLEFNGGATHSSTGYLPSITNGFANTFCNSLTNLPSTNCHMSFYSRTNITTQNTSRNEMGNIIAAGTPACLLVGSWLYLIGSGTVNTGGQSFTTTNTTLGLWLASKVSNSQRFGQRNGVLNTGSVLTANDTSALPSLNIFIGARNQSGSAVNYASKECAFATIGLGLTQQEGTTLYNIIQTFQTTLGRQV